MRWGFKPYVPVAKRRERAQKKIAKLNVETFPVEIQGRKIVTTFWGKAWCSHIESLGDYDNRLPRGRTYVRNGSVCHLQICKGQVKAMVAGSELYNIEINIKPINNKKWQKIKTSCCGKIESMLDLLSGNLSDGVMNVVCHREDGLFPLSSEIKLNCDCPDGAIMCKHVAAVLYGVGSRLDSKPAELFRLRGADHEEMIDISQAVVDITSKQEGKRKRLSTEDVSSIFDFDTSNEQSESFMNNVNAEANGPEKGQSRAPKILTGASISKQRKKLGLSKCACAEMLGVSVSSLAKWETFGRKKVIAIERSMKKLQYLW